MAKSDKYQGVTFTPNEVVQWSPSLVCPTKHFKCKRSEFAYYWKKGKIQREVGAHVSRCWVVVRDGLVGYIVLLADKLATEDQLLADEDIRYSTYPAVKIGLLATHKDTKGVGSMLVDWAMVYVARELSPLLGVRFMTVDALYDPDTGYDTSEFYTRLGFNFANEDEPLPPKDGFRAMYYDLKYLIDLIHNGGNMPTSLNPDL